MLPLLLLACSPVRLVDDTRMMNLEPVGASLGSPYVVGAQFTLTLETPGSPADWSIESEDDTVLLVGAPALEGDDGDAQLVVDAAAVGVGETTLVVRDDHGAEVLRPRVVVAAPTRVELSPARDVNENGDASPVTEPLVCVGGSSAFRVDFYDGAQALAGAGGLAVSAPGDGVSTDQSSFTGDHDWIVVTPTEAGSLTIALTAGDVPAGSVTVVAVDAAEIAGIALDRDSETGAARGDSLAVVATALDASGERIFGAPFEWTVDTLPAFQEGDQFLYTFDRDVSTVASVAVGDQLERFTVHGAGSVSASDSVVCAVANVGPVGLAVLLAALGAGRRRRG